MGAIGLAIAALAVAGAAGAFAFWAVRWARQESHYRELSEATTDVARRRVDDLTRDVKERDATLALKQIELDRAAATLRTTEQQRDDLQGALTELAASRPEVLGPAVRAAIDRLRVVAHQAASVPPAAPTAPAGTGDGPGAVPGADPGGPIGDRLLPMA